MSAGDNRDFDLTISRLIRAPRALVWSAWADPESFAQWWLPAPLQCRVVAMDLRPGGSFVTEMSADGGPFTPHLSACFLSITEAERIIFTNALVDGWRPAAAFYPTPITATITFKDHPDGTEYTSHVMHKDRRDRDRHEELGFHDGWGTVAGQLAALVEKRAAERVG